MPVSTFQTPSPITVTLDLYAADVRFDVGERTETVVEIRPSDPGKSADVKAAEEARVEYDDATGTLSIASKRRLNRFMGVTSKRPESIDVLIQLPSDSDVRGISGFGEFVADGVLGTVVFKTDMGAVRLAETASLNVRSGFGEITVEGVSGSAEAHTGSGEVRIGAVDGTAEVSNANGTVRIGVVTGSAAVKASNGSVSVDRALSDIIATSANGEVRIGEVVRGRVTATSKNGSVEVGVREGSAAWLDLNTVVGRVHNELAAADAPEAGEPVDKVEVHASTKLGDVTVRRAPHIDAED